MVRGQRQPPCPDPCNFYRLPPAPSARIQPFPGPQTRSPSAVHNRCGRTCRSRQTGWALESGPQRHGSHQPWTQDTTGIWEKEGENPAVLSAAAPSPVHFLSGCGEGWAAGQTTEKWGKSAASAGRGGKCSGEWRGRKKRGSLPDQESHLRGLPPSPLSCLWWGQRPQHGHLPHPQENGTELTQAENGPSGH